MVSDQERFAALRYKPGATYGRSSNGSDRNQQQRGFSEDPGGPSTSGESKLKEFRCADLLSILKINMAISVIPRIIPTGGRGDTHAYRPEQE